MKGEGTILSGVRPDGSYAYRRPDDAEIARWIARPERPRTSNLRGAGRYDADDLGAVGWAVVYPPGRRSRIEPLLRDLLEMREEQAGDLFRSIQLYPNETCRDFLERFGALVADADPRRLPYYLLLAGDPEEISFEFQSELDHIYAVGRLCFDREDHYRAYAASVRAAERKPPTKPERRITLFGALNEGDSATERTTNRLIRPLADTIEDSLPRFPGWHLERIVGPEATREKLADLLTGAEPPDILFTAGHGMVFDDGDPRQEALQGALLCSDWQGPDHPVTRDSYLAAEDLRIEGRPLAGTITLHLACHSGGTPALDSFPDLGATERKPLAPRPFVAALPQRLLAEAGALAVVAHVDRAWTTSFDWRPDDETPDPEVFERTLLPLLGGLRIGDATEDLGVQYGRLASQAAEGWELEHAPGPTRTQADRARTGRLVRAKNDIRSFVVFGDPAVKVGGRALERRTMRGRAG